MSCRVDTSPWIASSCIVSLYDGLGVLGSVMRATTGTGTNGAGILYNDWQAGDDAKEFRALLVTPPSGTLTLYEDGSFAYAGTSSSFTYQGFADGTSYGTGTVTLTVGSGDVTPPTLTGSITVGTVTTTSIAVTWPAGADNVAVTSYEVSSNNGTSYTDTGSTATGYTFTGLSTGTSYTLRVRAKDAAGNLSTPALSVTQSTSSVSPPTVTLTLTTDGSTPAANLTGQKWAFFDQVSPGSFLAPTAKGTTGSTNGSGVFSVNITGTALIAAQTGWLIVTNSDGTTTQNPAEKAFSGPVVVS